MEQAAITTTWDGLKNCLLFFCSRGDYFYDLKTDLTSLKAEKESLKETKGRFEKMVESHKTMNLQKALMVTEWLCQAGKKLEQADNIIEEGEDELQHKWLRWLFPKIEHCCSYNKVGQTVSKMVTDLAALRDISKFDSVFEKMPVCPVIEMPMEVTVGLENKFEEVWGFVEDSSSRFIGIRGRRGVGKTTLLKMINNNFCRTRLEVEVVIWITVSKAGDVEKIQEAIRKRFEIPEDRWKAKTVKDRAHEILRILRMTKFVLLLDDLCEKPDYEAWEQSDLVEVGVPVDGNENGSKIIFTTRLNDVCDRMIADQRPRVEPLGPEKSMELFKLYVRQETLSAHQDIPNLAKTLVENCEGLPKYLVNMGKVMVGKKNHLIWRHAINALQNLSTKSSNMDEKFFTFLKFFYNCLSDETIRICFLYCSSFEVGQNIEKGELIRSWIKEGLLRECHDEQTAYEEGESIIGKLKRACLLETGESDDFVKIPDMVHEMATRVANEQKVIKKSWKISTYNEMVEAGAPLLLTY